MASTSASWSDGIARRLQNTASTIRSDNSNILSDMRKAFSLMKEIAVDMEKINKSQEVKELEQAAMELLESYEECTSYSSALESVGNLYNPAHESTDFKKLLEGEVARVKPASSSNPEKQRLMRQFREAIWNVHHAGEPMPGDEQEDIIMTSTQCVLLNISCPLTGRPVTELAEPVRSMECKHIYDKKAIMAYLKSKHGSNRCPVAGCPKVMQAARVVCDPLLLVEIDEVRCMNKQAAETNDIEDCTALDEE